MWRPATPEDDDSIVRLSLMLSSEPDEEIRLCVSIARSDLELAL